METVEIKIKKTDFPRLRKVLESLDYLEYCKVTEGDIDIISVVAEKSLEEEWNSDEDTRWDELL
ncbi:MAG: hypothetical protein FD181_2802 [Prolixibacteraceae bacterium]|nr:MAG: hypothetical protein FD181_2802 [Prolixibacteraceae bacterium]